MRAMAIFDPGTIKVNPDYDPTITDPADPGSKQMIGVGLDWIDSLHLSLQQWHWDMLDDGHILVFMIIRNDVPHFRQSWEDTAPPGCLLLPSLLHHKATVPAKVHEHPELQKIGVLPTHTTFDAMKLLWEHDPKRYYLSRPDHF